MADKSEETMGCLLATFLGVLGFIFLVAVFVGAAAIAGGAVRVFRAVAGL